MDLRLFFAILVGRIISILNKLTGSGATAAPGLAALKIDPLLVKKLTKKLLHGNIIISGTNGKTTTARLTSEIASTKFRVVHNRQGSNLLRGIASTLISSSSFTGQCPADLGIWEVDEATLPEALSNIQPQIIVFLNLFRDQLDRYGEVDSVRKKWQKALQGLTLKQSKQGETLILNADDPGISILAASFKGKVTYFGIEDKKPNLPEIAQVADIRHCLNCGATLNFQTILSAHMGHYSCPNGDLERPNPTISASNLKFNPDFSTEAKISIHDSQFTIHYNLPGLYNVYNVLAAISVADNLKIDQHIIKRKVEDFSAAFGRYQSVQIGNKSAVILLIKNPAGANEVIRTLSLKDNLNIIAALNDKIADGRDVSWIWDTNWEILTPRVKNLIVSGTRAWDLATRLKYAGYKVSKNNIYENIDYSIKKSLENLNNKDTLIVLPTYTAMLEIQEILSKLGSTTKWHKD